MASFSDFVPENNYLKAQIIENFNTLDSATHTYPKPQEMKIVTVKEGSLWAVKAIRKVTLAVELSADVEAGSDINFNPKTLNAGLRILHEKTGEMLAQKIEVKLEEKMFNHRPNVFGNFG